MVKRALLRRSPFFMYMYYMELFRINDKSEGINLKIWE